MLKISLVTIGFVAAVSTANAQSSYDGGYWGVGLGYGSGDVSDFDATGDLSIKGPVVSGLVGWNASKGNMVYGVEVDLSFGKIDGSAPCANPSWTCEAQIKSLATLRGRLGVVQNGALFYLTAGGAAGRVELATINSGGTAFPGSQTATGWVAGIGVEGKLGATPWNYRLEYMQMDLGTETYTTDVDYTSDVKSGLLRFGVSRKF